MEPITILYIIVLITFLISLTTIVWDTNELLKIIPIIFITIVCLISIIRINEQQSEIESLKEGCPQYELIETQIYKKNDL